MCEDFVLSVFLTHHGLTTCKLYQREVVLDALPSYNDSEKEADRQYRRQMIEDYGVRHFPAIRSIRISLGVLSQRGGDQRRTRLQELSCTGSSKYGGPPGKYAFHNRCTRNVPRIVPTCFIRAVSFRMLSEQALSSKRRFPARAKRRH